MKNKKTKVIILCGGKGTRLAEETRLIPKPMVKIGPFPILRHIMNHYNKFGYNNFFLSTGYKSKYIENNLVVPNKFNSRIINTGVSTLTGGRIKRLQHLITDENFMATYGDGVSNVNIEKLMKFHLKHNKIATVLAVRPPARFGRIILKSNNVLSFEEKKQSNVGWINGGFFVFNRKIFSYIKDSKTILEQYPLERLANENQLMAYKHEGFWQCMDTIRDRDYLREIYKKNKKKFSP